MYERPTGAEHFDVSRQAISLHLKILSECGLLNIRQSGRERLCEAKLEKLTEVHEWVQQYRQLWAGKLKALKTFVEQEELQFKKADVKKKRAVITQRKIKKQMV